MGRLVKTVTLVNISCTLQAEPAAGAGDELPESRSCCTREGRRLPSTLDLSEPRHVLRHALLLKDPAGHSHEHARAIQANLHRRSAAAAIVVDELLDHRVDLKGKSE